jgi:hypothetical protein
LNAAEDKIETAEATTTVKSVAATILSEFFDVLEKEKGLGEVALNLRKVVLDDAIFAEPSIRTALFPDAS